MVTPHHAGMILSRHPSNVKPTWESLLVVGSVTFLSALAVADRVTAWLIGEFPTYSLFWQLRFEFLRPIGAYYDLVTWHFAQFSPAMFSAAVLFTAALIAGGVVSRIRLARAISCHLLLAAALVLCVLSSSPGNGVHDYRPFGMPSEPYAFIGAMLSLVAIALCLRIHAEYIGWTPVSSPVARRARYAVLRFRKNLNGLVAGLAEQSVPAPRRLRAALARTNRYRNPNR